MQDELTPLATPLEIQILGVNGAGYEGGNASITNGRDLPWLQDTSQAQVWASWEVAYRDVVVLDEDNAVFAVYNLTEHDLSNPANYAELKAILIEAAGGVVE